MFRNDGFVSATDEYLANECKIANTALQHSLLKKFQPNVRVSYFTTVTLLFPY